MATRIVVPELGESIVAATVVCWHKHEGDVVAVGEVLLELETEKVNLEVGAEHAGVLARIERQEGEDVQVGEVLGILEDASETAATAPTTLREAPLYERATPEVHADPSASAAAPPETPPRIAAHEKVTPVAQRLAQKHAVDLHQVPRRSPGGRLTKRDVETYLAQQQSEPETSPAAPAPAEGRTRREERRRLSRRRRTIARRLVEAQRTAAILTTYNEVDMSAVMALRTRRKAAFQERHGVNLGILSFFVKAAVSALRDFPQLNAEIQDEEVVLKHYYDIGIAIGATEGLVVPVLQDADRLSFAAIERAIKIYVGKAERDTLSLEDLRGGTFTITNGGVLALF